jgi:hypothetical protein
MRVPACVHFEWSKWGSENEKFCDTLNDFVFVGLEKGRMDGKTDKRTNKENITFQRMMLAKPAN